MTEGAGGVRHGDVEALAEGLHALAAAGDAAEGIARPTPTALAAKTFMERIGGKAHQDVIENRAILGGWRGARQAGCRDVELSDAIARAALGAVMDLFRAWAAECGEAPELPARVTP